jgi:hypothetical protein
MQNILNTKINTDGKSTITVVKTVEETYTVEELLRKIDRLEREKERMLDRIENLQLDYEKILAEQEELKSLLESVK